jgi:hypothetical protein
MLDEQLDQPRIVSEQIDGPSLDVGEDSRVVVLDRKRHILMLAYLITFDARLVALIRRR